MQRRVKGRRLPASSSKRNKTGIVLYQKINSDYKYLNYPENTLGQKIRKQRFLKGLTATELGKLCGCVEGTIYSYESDFTKPHYTVMKKICTILEVPIQYFNDDYYNFVLSDDYANYLKKWRKENTARYDDVKKILGVSYKAYRDWEEGSSMTRKIFNKIKDKISFC